MEKATILKYIEGTASEAERLEVLSWVEQSEENRRFFAAQKNLWVQLHLPSSKTYEEDDFKAIKRKISRQRNGSPVLFYLQRAAAILFFPLIGTTLYLLLSKDTHNTVMERKVAIAQQEYYTNKGVKGVVELPDGSKVWLNSDSRISYPEYFSGKYRAVHFSGEGYFEVTHDPMHPMLIEMDKGLCIEVKGTTFNLCTYSNDSEVVATLVEGSIAMYSEGNKVTDMEPLQSLKVSADKQFILSQEKDVSRYYAWKDGWLIFDNTPMPDVLRRLERWHGVSFTVNNPELLNHSFTARFNSESIIQVMELLNLSLDIRYSIKDAKVTLFK